MRVTLTAAAALIQRRADNVDTPVLVALDGYSGAGKSTAAGWLAESLNAAVVHIDDFYRDITEQARLRLSPFEGVDRYFDWQRLREDALAPLRHGLPANFRRFDWAAGDGLNGEQHIPARHIVIIEGVYSARPELVGYIDSAVLVDTPASQRRRRIQDRNEGSRLWQARWDAAESLYFHTIRPPSSFALTIAGSN